MIDGVIIGNGTSRLVKGTLPATYAEFSALAASSGVPMDVIFNAAGWQQQPTFLNKANLLQDSTADLLDLAQADPTVNDAFIGMMAYVKNSAPSTFQKLMTGRLI